MNALFVLIPVSIVFLLIAIAIFIWCIRSNQFENLDSAALDILASDNEVGSKPNTSDAD